MNPISNMPPIGLFYVRVDGNRWFFVRAKDGKLSRFPTFYAADDMMNYPLPGEPEGWIGTGFENLKMLDEAWGRPYGDYGPGREACPYCGLLCDCDAVDVGVGFQQVGPYHCVECGASQIGPHDKPRPRTPKEHITNWYEPGSEPGSSANVIGGKIVSSGQMLDAYKAQFTANPDWHDKDKVSQWYEDIRKP